MRALYTLVLAIQYWCVVTADIILNPGDDVTVHVANTENGLNLSTLRGTDIRHVGFIANNRNKNYTATTNNRTLAILDFGEDVKLNLNVIVSTNMWQIQIHWTGPKTVRHEDCISFGTFQWYGGPEQRNQYWPVQKLNLSEYSYVSKERDNSAIAEPYWLSSQGTIIYVHPHVPLFIDQNNIKLNHLCLISHVKEPYSSTRTENVLMYDLVFTKNARVGHEYAVSRYLGKPIGYPDYRMIQHPIWSTWARYSRPINQSTVLEYAQEIFDNKFGNSQIEIDDFWETCYGELAVDIKKFPDFKGMVKTLKSMGFRVTLWIHPFINNNCPIFQDAERKGYLVKDEIGSVLTQWWNSNGKTAGYIDFTNSEATFWWSKRLIDLQNEYDLDSFKFDAGESSWSPQIPVQAGSVDFHPSHITEAYVRAVAEFGPMIEIRAGRRTQDLPVFVRMLDKDTTWTFDNGLPTLITTLLQMNMNGYTLVLPDMIGGNGYGDTKPSGELFIRWLQANVFMPSLQYSFVPWDFRNKTIESICETYTDLHARFADKIVEAMKKCVFDGSPVNPPIWWLDPEDQDALPIWDEFLLGDDILIAPMLTEGSVSRDIYLPMGSWRYQGLGDVIPGKQWLRNFSAPLDVLPYFVKV